MLKKDRFFEESAFELDFRPDLTVLDRDRAFVTDLRAGGNDRSVAVNPASRIDGHLIAGDLLHIDFLTDIKGERVPQINPLLNQFLNLIEASWIKVHGRECLKCLK